MLKLKSRESESHGLRSRSPRILILIGVLVVAVVGAGLLLVTASSGSDDIEVATDLIDDWHASWNDNDPEAIAAVFTEDGVYVLPPDWQWDDVVGRAAILRHARQYAATVTDVARTGDLVATDTENAYRFPARWVASGIAFEAEGQVVMDGDLASQIAWVSAVEVG